MIAEGLSWKQDAICAQVGGDEWFPEKGASTREAKRICMGCNVRERCLEYALENGEEYGIWGARTVRERRQLKRGQPLTPCKVCGTEFVTRAEGEGHRLRRYCSDHCRKVAHRVAKRESDRRRSAA